MRREPVRCAVPRMTPRMAPRVLPAMVLGVMPRVLSGVVLAVLLALGVHHGAAPVPEEAASPPPATVVLVSAVLPASVNAVRPDVQLAAERLTGDGAAVWLFVAAVCALLAGAAPRRFRLGGDAARPVGSSLIVLGALGSRAPPHVVR